MNESTYPNEVATLNKSATSPTGNHQLAITVPDPEKEYMLSFEIKNQNDEVVFVPELIFNNQSVTFFLWDEAERVWVYSGDIGTFFWQLDEPSGEWEMFTYAQENVEAPQFLKDVRPKRFDN